MRIAIRAALPFDLRINAAKGAACAIDHADRYAVRAHDDERADARDISAIE